MNNRGRKNSLLIYLFLNVVVSAATVLAVLVIWDRVKQNQQPPTVPPVSAPADNQTAPTAAPTLQPTRTPAPLSDGPVIEIASIIGAGDPAQEYVLVRRLGEGDLSLAGWKLEDQNGNAYTFPSSPELILFKDGAVQVYTRVGSDTPAEVFWNRGEPVWQSGETATLKDANGAVQATYTLP